MKLHFDGWEFDPESGDLERSGTRIRLQEQPSQVLRELIANAGSVVSREQLVALLWPKGVVDFDTGINTAIRKLRSALGDDPEQVRYIETIPRRGYRFIATLDAGPQAAAGPDIAALASAPPSAAAEGGEATTPVAVLTSAASPPRRRPWLPVLIGFAALGAAGAWYGVQSAHTWRDPLVNARWSRLTALVEKEGAAAISRDGRSAVFLADRDGHTDVYFTEIESGKYQNLTQGNVPDLVNPSIRPLGFSPDGSLVTVWSRRATGSGPGDINLLAASPRDGSVRPFLHDAAEIAWSGDAKRMAYHTTAPGDPIFVGEAGKQNARRIYTAPSGVHCHFPIWSRDDSFIYFVRGVPGAAWDIWRIRPTGSDLERITAHNSMVSHPVFLDARTLLYLAWDADGSAGLYSVDVKERVPHRLSFGLEHYTSIDASADGERLVATVTNPKISLWTVPIGEANTVGATQVRAGSEPLSGFSPRFGANFLLYVSARGDRQSIWRLSNATNSELWSRAHSKVVGMPDVSPDGKRIAFTVAEGDRTLLYVMDVDGTHARVVSDALVLRGNPTWSADSKSIVSAVLREGEPRLDSIFLDGSPPAPLAAEFSIDPVWSPDGRFLIYSGADLGTTFPLRAIASDGRPYGLPTPILGRGARRVVFSRDGHAIVVLRGGSGHKNFWLIDLASGTERQLTNLPPDFEIRDFDIDPAGGRVVFDRVEEDSQIALIDRAH